MANTFKLKTKANVGVTTSNVYVVPLTSCSVGVVTPLSTYLLPPPVETVTVKVVALFTVVMVLPIPLPCTVQ